LFAEDEQFLEERRKLVVELREMVLQWISEESNLSDFKGELLMLGSFRMEVCGKDSDIDTCVVAPACISREQHFFGNFFAKLK
jgi:poly(A) polymerase Pap1